MRFHQPSFPPFLHLSDFPAARKQRFLRAMVERHATIVVDVSILHSAPYFSSSESGCLLCMRLSYVVADLHPFPRGIFVRKLIWAVFRQIARNDVEVFSKSFVIRS